MNLPFYRVAARPLSRLRSIGLLTGLLAVSAAGSGCAQKRAEYSVSGTDEDRLEQHAARMEEFRSRSQAGEIPCPERCSVSREVCAISADVCEISSRQPDRTDLAQRCTQSQEDCARFNDDCAQCG